VSLVDELLTYADTSMDVFMADALAAKLDDIERIDRLSTIAEDRRNAHLTEIERRGCPLHPLISADASGRLEDRRQMHCGGRGTSGNLNAQLSALLRARP
jgi:hypothetical protein